MATKTKYFNPVKPKAIVPAKVAPKAKAPDRKPSPAQSKSSGPSTKDKIERAATALFSRNGVDGTSTRDLAAAAGVSEGVIYRYFKSKDELARTLMVAGHERLAKLVRAAEQSGDRLSENVDAIVTGYCAFADEDWDAFIYYVLHFHRYAGFASEAADSPMGAAVDIITRAQSRGEIPAGDPVIKASMALGIVLQTATTKIYGQINGNLSEYAAQFRAAIMAVLLTDAR